MAKHPLWQDEYWLLLMQLYLKKPVGLKPLYSKPLVNLSLELHIPPQFLHQQMFRLRSLDTPRLERLWETYSKSPRKLSRGVKLLRQKMGFNSGGDFFEGVEMNETFEKDFKPLEQDPQVTPVKLIMILDLYFRLTPNTMVEETAEIQDLSKMLRLSPSKVVNIMDIFQVCDPYLRHAEMIIDPLLGPCQQIWNRYGSEQTERLSALALQLRDYFK